MKILAEDFKPPAPWRTFYVRLYNSGGSRWYAPVQRQTCVSGLTDEELWWVGEVVLRELASRRNGSNGVD
jgi:hypothetical protein